MSLVPVPGARPHDLPELPAPTRERWQPLRVGLVDLFHYDCEEFWFRDGHLLLRGNNGTGKSKVLSLTLPFLLDASLSAARVEPDGDRGKRMEWNLLMNRYERRIGYTFLEFGRRDGDGNTHYLTLGCGLRAIAGRARVEPWYFWTDLRVGAELWLITPERTAISRERLAEAIAGRGRVTDNAREYRKAVDERLFQLGDRYDGLIDTLIQLRHPQLSRKPDERTLSEALSNALPELPHAVLEDVADAMNQLDEYRDELMQIDRVRDAIAAFDKRYRVYARIQARRRARVLRQAQTEFDNQSRTLNDARDQRKHAQAELLQQHARRDQLSLGLRRDRAALDELQSDPAMTDARRLADLEAALRAGQREHAAAIKRQAAAHASLEHEHREYGRREHELAAARDAARISEDDAQRAAALAGFAREHERLVAHALGATSDSAAFVELARELAALARRRLLQTAQVRARLATCERAERERRTAQARAETHRGVVERAETAARGAHRELELSEHRLLEAWRAYLDGLQVLLIDDPETGLGELSLWVESLAGEQPMRRRALEAHRAAETRLAARKSALDARAAALDAEDSALRQEEVGLLSGEQILPTAPVTRAANVRDGRSGAPLWRLLEFQPNVATQARAGLEAALEAAGLLDAWVTPAGIVLHPDTHDAWLRPGRGRAHSLLDWVLPASSAVQAAGIEPAHLQSLLASIACGPEDDAEADSWLSASGQFRIGRLRGAFGKAQAQYLGHEAREAQRQRRLAEIAARRAELAQLTAVLATERGRLQAERILLERELTSMPSDDALRHAHLRYSAAEIERSAALERLAEADAALQRAERALRDARAELERDASDLQLPTDPAALLSVENVLGAYPGTSRILCQSLSSCVQCSAELQRQQQREMHAAEELSSCQRVASARKAELDQAEARFELVREATLARVTELQRRLAALQAAVTSGERDLGQAHELVSEVSAQCAGLEQRVQDGQALLEERTRARREAADALQGFAATGLLGVALPELEQPEPSGWSVDPALNLARRMEQLLIQVPAEDHDWTRVQNDVSRDYTTLGQALSALGQAAQMDQSDFGLLVQIVYQNRPQRPDLLERALAAEIEQRRGILDAREREVLEKHLQAEVASALQRLLREAETRIDRINVELKRRPTSTGVYFRLEWEALPEASDGAPVGLHTARTRLLRQLADAWSPEDRRVVGEFLQTRIASERAEDDSGPLVDHLSRALDYRRWHRFRVKRWHDGAFRPLSGPASSGERALGLTVPLFAAASSHYATCDNPHAPRLVLLDEAFAGIDDDARAHCMALIREFDLDFVMTSEREWGCYASLPGVAICNIVRREDIDAVFVSRWTWDGRQRRAEPDPTRRYRPAAAGEPSDA